jgi:hypothetical protein
MIYVALTGGGAPVWRAVPAEEVAESEFVLGGTMPEDEQWEFEPGTCVRCEERTFSDGSRGLVAVERVLAGPCGR